jgi:dTDP-glucose 4,6-dehydratase
LTIVSAVAGKPIPVYARGENVRDWIFVDDHAAALLTILMKGRVGGSYLVGGDGEQRNIDVVRTICALLDELAPDPQGAHERLITFVADRPGHDFRYAIDASRLQSLGWRPARSFADGIRETVHWYLENGQWCDRVRSRR